MVKFLAAFTLILLLLAHPARWYCFETDQYNLPPTPLADIGGEVYEYTLENINKAIEKLPVAHQAAAISPSRKFQKTRSFTVQRARKAMNAAKVWFARLLGSATKT